jgi:hypothetical protein
MDNLRKLELLEELAILKRRQRAVNDFNFFIDTYLSHITTAQPPLFHAEIKELLENTTKTGVGGSTPKPPSQNNTLTPPHFLEKNTKPLYKKNRLLLIAPR